MTSQPLDPSDMTGFVKGMRAMMGWNNDDVTKTKVETTYKTIDGTNGPIPLRIYTPTNEGILPAVVFFHGGGFMGGSVDVVENPCKALAEKAGAVVVSVDYRLAPEHSFPAGLTDCFDTVKWVYEQAEDIRVNSQQIAVSGDSAGGNLATVCALMDHEKGTGMIKFQALIYPTVNMSAAPTEDLSWSSTRMRFVTILSLSYQCFKGWLEAVSYFSSYIYKIMLKSQIHTFPHCCRIS